MAAATMRPSAGSRPLTILTRLEKDTTPGLNFVCEAGLLSHPAVDLPGPMSLEEALETVVVQTYPEACEAEGLEVPPAGERALSGAIYVDGSCARHVIKDLPRSGWGAAMVGVTGQ
eukprot:648178-Pyramimonas_sp.AAC.1